MWSDLHNDSSMVSLRQGASSWRMLYSKEGSVVRFRKDEIDEAINAGSLRVKQAKSSDNSAVP